MLPQSVTMLTRVLAVMAGGSSRRVALATATAVLGFAGAALAASYPNYDFLTVSGNNIGGNGASSTFTSQNGNGVIRVTHSFSAGGAGGADNLNNLINPSQFTTLFPGTGQVQGHLAQTVYANTSVVTFDLTGYNLSTSTVFGMWNTTDEVTGPIGPGGGTTPVYQVQLMDSSSNIVNPTTFSLLGDQDNQTQVAGRHQMVMNTSTGEITFGALLNPFGTHTDAAFWRNIPAGTKEIIVYGNLPPLNNIGDGVGYYFAELIPEPASLTLIALGGLTMMRGKRR